MLKNRVQLLPKHGWFDFSLAPTVQCGTPLTKDGLLSMGAVKLFQDGSLQGVHRLSEQSLPFAAGRHLRRVMARIPHLQSP